MPITRRHLLPLLALPWARPAAAHAVPETWVRPAGRVAPAPGGGWLATWPGVSWTLRFTGDAVGVTLDDAGSHWLLEIDGAPRLQIDAAAGPRTVWLRGLGEGEHVAQLIKRSENAQQAAHVIGFVLEAGARPLPPPEASGRRIEFLGDSFTAAMGNLAKQRACADGEVARLTDVTQGYAVRAARALGADWRIHAVSGRGLVRNWNGGRPGETHGTHYARLLQDRPGPPPDDGWRPDTVVVGLGINDFSTPVRADEPRDAEALERDFLAAYRRLLAALRGRGPEPRVVLLSAGLGHGDRLRPLVARLVEEQRAAGWRRIAALDWGSLSAQGCGSHPDLDDHRRMAARLVELLAAMP